MAGKLPKLAREGNRKQPEREHDGKLAHLALFLVIGAMFVVPVGSRKAPNSEEVCVKCDPLRTLSSDLFEERFWGACQQCGDLYTEEHAICCLCHKDIYQMCRLALGLPMEY